MTSLSTLKSICQLIRYNILTITTAAGSGHPTSSLSAVELMTTLFFGGFLRCDFKKIEDINNDRLIFSKGHAAPLLYSLYQVAGIISPEELLRLRQFDSPLQGHPIPNLPGVEVATGSLGQGLSLGIGMCLGFKLKKSSARTFVLLGDSELAEGQNWEAIQVAAHYQLNNLIAILDVNRLGQRGETMLGWDLYTYAQRITSFGWKTITITDGHNLELINQAYQELKNPNKPTMIIAKTIKGKGVDFLENQANWHGKVLDHAKLQQALSKIGTINKNLQAQVSQPIIKNQSPSNSSSPIKQLELPNYHKQTTISTREAYADTLVKLGALYPNLLVLDAETSNSTYTEKFKLVYPERFFEMYIAEQNMISVAVGLAKIGFIPFVSSFAAFLTRGFDQIRMAQYSKAELKIGGSHAGVSIGADGPSQMGLEDIAMARSILESVVMYPADAVSTFKIMATLVHYPKIVYLRLTREKTPIIYSFQENFPIGGAKILRESPSDQAVIFTAGITLFEALKAYETLKYEGINIAVIDLYSLKPLDEKIINQFAQKTKNVITVEDHYPAGGIGEAVKSCIKISDVNFISLSVSKIPRSGTMEELLHYEEIDSEAIVKHIKTIL
jgi:transketolase